MAGLRRNGLFVASIVSSSGLLFWLSSRIDWEQLIAAFGSISQTVIAASLVLYLASIYAATWRYTLVLRQTGLPQLRVLPLLPVNYLAVALSLIAPVSAAGDAVRVVHAWKNLGLTVERALMATFLDRLAGIVAIVALCLVSMPYHWVAGLHPSLVWIELISVGGGVLAVAALGLMRRSRNVMSWRIAAGVASLFDSLRRLYSTARMCGLQILIATIVVGAQGMTLWLLKLDMGSQLDSLFLLSLVPLIMLVQNLPFLYAGWGAREAILVTALSGPGGMTAEAALAISIMIGLIRMLASAPGLIFLPALRPTETTPVTKSWWSKH